MMKALFLALVLILAVEAHRDHHHHHERPHFRNFHGATTLQNLQRGISKQTREMNERNTWAVLVAGSSTWSNYRHQADILHAYQIIHKAGVPDERIVIFMYDDIANNAANPYPGKVFNKITTGTAADVDVYAGAPKDYTGRDATADNLVAVLTGETPVGGSGKTLKSTENDNVFFYYDDHGNVGLVAMPYGRYFVEADMKNVFAKMSEKKMFKEFIILVQACESGSMFYRQDLPDGVYVSTSAPVRKSAYACNYDPRLRTYISSCWPYYWLNAIEDAGFDTTFDHILTVAYDEATTASGTSPCQYGDADLRANTISGFFNPSASSAVFVADNADEDDRRPPPPPPHRGHGHRHGHGPRHFGMHRRPFQLFNNESACPQYDVPYQIAKLNYANSHSEADLVELQRQTEIRKKIDAAFHKVIDAAFPANSANSFLKTPVCQSCTSCDCYDTCVKEGKSADFCEHHCCNYGGCFDKNSNSAKVTCSRALAEKFLTQCGHFNNDYIYAASPIFDRACRTPGIDVQAALAEIKNVCSAN